jgi:hypothetical protein
MPFFTTNSEKIVTKNTRLKMKSSLSKKPGELMIKRILSTQTVTYKNTTNLSQFAIPEQRNSVVFSAFFLRMALIPKIGAEKGRNQSGKG